MSDLRFALREHEAEEPQQDSLQALLDESRRMIQQRRAAILRQREIQDRERLWRIAQRIASGELGRMQALAEDLDTREAETVSRMVEEIQQRQAPERSYAGRLGQALLRGAAGIAETPARLAETVTGHQPHAVVPIIEQARAAEPPLAPAGPAGWPIQAAEMAPPMIAGIAAHAVNPMASVMFWAGQIAPTRYQQYIEKGMKPEEARQRAAVSAVIEGAIEQFIPNPFARTAVRSRIGSRIAKIPLGRLRDFAFRYAGEMAEEAAQELTAELIGNETVSEAVRSALEAAVEAAGPLLVLMGAPSAARAGIETVLRGTGRDQPQPQPQPPQAQAQPQPQQPQPQPQPPQAQAQPQPPPQQAQPQTQLQLQLQPQPQPPPARRPRPVRREVQLPHHQPQQPPQAQAQPQPQQAQAQPQTQLQLQPQQPPPQQAQPQTQPQPQPQPQPPPARRPRPVRREVQLPHHLAGMENKLADPKKAIQEDWLKSALLAEWIESIYGKPDLAHYKKAALVAKALKPPLMSRSQFRDAINVFRSWYRRIGRDRLQSLRQQQAPQPQPAPAGIQPPPPTPAEAASPGTRPSAPLPPQPEQAAIQQIQPTGPPVSPPTPPDRTPGFRSPPGMEIAPPRTAAPGAAAVAPPEAGIEVPKHVAPEEKEEEEKDLSPVTSETVPRTPKIKDRKYAKQKRKAAEVHGDVQQPEGPPQRVEEVPPPERGEGVREGGPRPPEALVRKETHETRPARGGRKRSAAGAREPREIPESVRETAPAPQEERDSNIISKEHDPGAVAASRPDDLGRRGIATSPEAGDTALEKGPIEPDQMELLVDERIPPNTKYYLFKDLDEDRKNDLIRKIIDLEKTLSGTGRKGKAAAPLTRRRILAGPASAREIDRLFRSLGYRNFSSHFMATRLPSDKYALAALQRLLVVTGNERFVEDLIRTRNALDLDPKKIEDAYRLFEAAEPAWSGSSADLAGALQPIWGVIRDQDRAFIEILKNPDGSLGSRAVIYDPNTNLKEVGIEINVHENSELLLTTDQSFMKVLRLLWKLAGVSRKKNAFKEHSLRIMVLRNAEGEGIGFDGVVLSDGTSTIYYLPQPDVAQLHARAETVQPERAREEEEEEEEDEGEEDESTQTAEMAAESPEPPVPPGSLSRQAVPLPQTQARPLGGPEMVQLAGRIIRHILNVPADQPITPILVRKLPKSWGRFRMKLAKSRIFAPGPGAVEEAVIILSQALGESAPSLRLVLAHEIGHALDAMSRTPGFATTARGNMLGRLLKAYKFMKAVTPESKYYNEEIVRELKELSLWWNGGKRRGGWNRPAELYADAISVLLNAPAELAERAPKFWKVFFDLLVRKNPEGLQALSEAFAAMEGTDEDVARRRLDYIRAMFDRSEQQLKLLVMIYESQKRSFAGRVFEFLTAHLISNYRPIWKRIGGSRKIFSFSPKGQYAAQTASALYDLADPNRPVITYLKRVARIDEEAARAGISRDTIGQYILLQRVIHGDRKEFINPLGLSPDPTEPGGGAQAMLDTLLKDLGPRAEKLVDLVNSLFEETRRVLKDAWESGLLSDRRFAELEELSDAYAPFLVIRHMGTDLYVPGMPMPETGNVDDLVRPYESLVMKMASLARMAHMNRARRRVIEFIMKDEKLSKDISDAVRLPPGQTRPGRPDAPDAEWVVFWKNGAKYAVHLPAHLARVLTRDRDALDRVAGVFSNAIYRIFHPLLITFNPNFWAGNIPADLHRSVRNLNAVLAGMRKSLTDELNSLNLPRERVQAAAERFDVSVGEFISEFRKAWRAAREFVRSEGRAGQEVEELRQAGGLPAYFGKVPDHLTGEDQFIRTLEKFGVLKPKPPPWHWRLNRWPRALLEYLEGITVTQEIAPKLAAWKILRKRGVPSEVAALTAVRYIGTPDMADRPLAHAMTSSLLMYWRAKVNGILADMELAHNPKTAAEWWWYTLWTGFMPLVLKKAARIGLFGLGLKKIFDTVPQHLLTDTLVMPLGWIGGGDGDDEKDTPGLLILVVAHDRMTATLNRLVWSVFDILSSATGIGDETEPGTFESSRRFFEGLFDVARASFNPFLQIADVWRHYLSSKDPPKDPFRNIDIASRDEVQAGEAWKPVLYWTLDQFGVLSVLGRSATTKFFGPAYGEPDPPPLAVRIRSTPGLSRLMRVVWPKEKLPLREIEADEALTARERLAIPSALRTYLIYFGRTRNLDPHRISRDTLLRRQQALTWYNDVYLPARDPILAAKERGDEAEYRRLSEQLVRRSREVMEPSWADSTTARSNEWQIMRLRAAARLADRLTQAEPQGMSERQMKDYESGIVGVVRTLREMGLQPRQIVDLWLRYRAAEGEKPSWETRIRLLNRLRRYYRDRQDDAGLEQKRAAS